MPTEKWRPTKLGLAGPSGRGRSQLKLVEEVASCWKNGRGLESGREKGHGRRRWRRGKSKLDYDRLPRY